MTKLAKQITLWLMLAAVTVTSSGCTMPMGMKAYWYLFTNSLDAARFWWSTPVIPVSHYYSQMIEDTYHENERYGKIPILDPVEGEHAPLFCLDPPSPDEVVRSLPDPGRGGFAFLAESSRNNIRIVVEPIVDRIDECRFFPMVGPARLHHCHYKCTLYYDKMIRSSWPVPFMHKDETQDVVYIDHDHLIRCAGPAAN